MSRGDYQTRMHCIELNYPYHEARACLISYTLPVHPSIVDYPLLFNIPHESLSCQFIKGQRGLLTACIIYNLDNHNWYLTMSCWSRAVELLLTNNGRVRLSRIL